MEPPGTLRAALLILNHGGKLAMSIESREVLFCMDMDFAAKEISFRDYMRCFVGVMGRFFRFFASAIDRCAGTADTSTAKIKYLSETKF